MFTRTFARHLARAYITRMHGWDGDDVVPVTDGREVSEVLEEESPREAAIRQLALTVLEDDNPVLSLDCLVSMIGILRSHDSAAAIAARHGVTRAEVSKRCLTLSERLGIPYRFGRSQTTRNRCRKSRLAATT
jgi:hypothetical protein